MKPFAGLVLAVQTHLWSPWCDQMSLHLNNKWADSLVAAPLGIIKGKLEIQTVGTHYGREDPSLGGSLM